MTRGSGATIPTGGRAGGVVVRWLAVVILAWVWAGVGGAAPAQAQERVPTPGATSRYFAETGHNLQEPFLSRWEAAGGEAVLGLPLSEERYVEGSGGVLQTFEALTLVYDPTLAQPWDVQGQHLPASVRDQGVPRSARAPVTGCPPADGSCRFFPETGHTIGGRFAAFWASHGDLAILGLPLSEPFVVDGPEDGALTV